jgi:hypothetical protein
MPSFTSELLSAIEAARDRVIAAPVIGLNRRHKLYLDHYTNHAEESVFYCRLA